MADVTNIEDLQAYILKLPPELMESVATHVPAEDLLALRLTCRDVNSKTLRVFARVHFTDKTFLLAYAKSMQALENITQHAVFGKYLETIRLSALQVLNSSSDERKRDPSGDRPTREERRSHREIRQLHCALSTDQSSCMQAKKWRHSLSRALINIKANHPGSAIIVELHGYLEDNQPAVGEKDLERKLGYQGCLANYSWSQPNIAPTLLKVLLDAGCPILELAMGSRFGVELDFLASSMVRVKGFAATFDKLQRLDIIVCGTDTALAAVFAESLPRLPGLQTLVLRNGFLRWGDGTHFITAIASQAYIPNLRQIELRGMRAHVGDIVLFVTRHKHTLERITLGVGGTHSDDERSMTQAEAEGHIRRGVGDRRIEVDLSWRERYY